jgi:hypothetical protein
MKRRDQTSFDGYAERLQHSPNPHERNSYLLGLHLREGWPVLWDSGLRTDHIHILGGTGTGKTALGLITLVQQMIHRNDWPLVIVDCKGDPAFFNTVWHETLRAGRTFKWFTTKPNRSTYIFDPFDQRVLEGMSVSDIVGFIIQYLNLYHGVGYGRSWFGFAARVLLQRAVERTLPRDHRLITQQTTIHSPLFHQEAPIHSLRDLHKIVSDMTSGDSEYKAGLSLAYTIESLVNFDQISVVPSSTMSTSAMDHAIRMSDVIRNKQVVYFYLVGAVDLASVATIARMVLYSLVTAMIAHKDRYGIRPNAGFICDEAQAIISNNIQVILEQARSHGLGCVLSHQTKSQLNEQGGPDLRELVLGCMATKQYFSARDPWLQAYLSKTSGQVKYFTQSYDQLADDVLAGNIGPQFVAPGRDGVRRIGIQEYVGPRLTIEEIRDYSRLENVSLVSIDHSKGLSQLRDWTPTYTDWPMSRAQYGYRGNQVPWPPQNDATITPMPDWPTGDSHTILATADPYVTNELVQQNVSQKLRGWMQGTEEE